MPIVTVLFKGRAEVKVKEIWWEELVVYIEVAHMLTPKTREGFQ
jgi:hypothetical protein